MKKYPFEEQAYNRIEKNQNVLRQTLGERLNVITSSDGEETYHDFSGGEKYKIEAFLSTFNGNINWYENEITEENEKIKNYKRLTVFLIALIPVSVLTITIITSNSPSVKTLESVSSLVVALLSSIIGLHKVTSQWIDRRKFLSNYHQATSDLKSRFYEFEYEWNDRDILDSEGQILKDFDQALEQVISDGRRIAAEERQGYFEALESPTVDIGNILSSSFTSASGIFDNFKSKSHERRMQELENEQQEIKDMNSLLQDISESEKEIELLSRRKDSLASEFANEKDPKEKVKLRSRMDAIVEKLDEKEVDLIGKKAKVRI